MKALLTLYVIAMLTVMGYGLYHAPWFVKSLLVFPLVAMIAAGLLDDYMRFRVRSGGQR